MVAKAWQEASWFGISQCDQKKKIQNKQTNFIHR